MPLEPEPDVDSAPCPPTDPPGSPEPSESAKPRTAKKKSKVEAWKITVATIWKSSSGLVAFLSFPKDDTNSQTSGNASLSSFYTKMLRGPVGTGKFR